MDSKNAPGPRASGWGRLWQSGVPATVLGVVLMLALAAMTPVWIDDDLTVNDQPPTDMKARASVRRIQLAANGHSADVVRYPAEWQTVDVATGAVQHEEVVSPHYHGAMQRIGTPDEAVVYLNHEGCCARLLRGTQPARCVIPHQPGEVFGHLAASPQHDRVALARPQSLQLWSITEGSLQTAVELKAGVAAVEWSPDGTKLLLLLSDGQMQIRHGQTLEIQHSQATGLRGSGHVTWAESGQSVAAHDDTGTVVTWNLSAGQVESHASNLTSIRTFALAPRGEFLVMPDDLCDVWVLPTVGPDRERRYLGTADAKVSALCLFNKGQSLLVGTMAGTLESWSTLTGMPLWDRQPKPTENEVPIEPSPSPMDEAAPFAQHGNSCTSAA